MVISMSEYRKGQCISIRVPRCKRAKDYPLGSTQPLMSTSSASVIGEWQVMTHRVTPVGEFVLGQVVSVQMLQYRLD